VNYDRYDPGFGKNNLDEGDLNLDRVLTRMDFAVPYTILAF
jgi:hypothetical protein